MFDYFYGAQAEQFAFYRVPKVLFTNDRFKYLSAEAKTLYGILLDRVPLSAKNGWIDEQGRVYIICTIEEIMADMNCGNKKAIQLLSDLEDKVGLIERKRQGLGKPNLIYVKNFISVDSPVERHYLEYGSARWGGPKDIEPFIDPVFENNVILTKTERLMMSNRPKNPANARNKNVLIVGGSGSGKTRFWIKPNLLQLHSSYDVGRSHVHLSEQPCEADLIKGYGQGAARTAKAVHAGGHQGRTDTVFP